jgi:hypothetical protein
MWTENTQLILYEQFVLTFQFCFIRKTVNTFLSQIRSVNMYYVP